MTGLNPLLIDVESDREIGTPASRVWAILTDFSLYPSWNSVVWEIHGVPQEGSPIEVSYHKPSRYVLGKGKDRRELFFMWPRAKWLEEPRGKELRFHGRVVAAEPERKLRWRGRTRSTLSLECDHEFEIAVIAQDRVRLRQRMSLHGSSVPFIKTILGRWFSDLVAGMNRELWKRAEDHSGQYEHHRPSLVARVVEILAEEVEGRAYEQDVIVELPGGERLHLFDPNFKVSPSMEGIHCRFELSAFSPDIERAAEGTFQVEDPGGQVPFNNKGISGRAAHVIGDNFVLDFGQGTIFVDNEGPRTMAPQTGWYVRIANFRLDVRGVRRLSEAGDLG